MTVADYVIWIVGMAIFTTVVLTVSTLAAADLLPRRGDRPGPRPAADPRTTHRSPAEAAGTEGRWTK